jgi:uncharacterized protein (DUF433 family)
MTPTISKNGRIEGTRTSVYDIVPYLEGNRFTLDEIAQYNAISMEQLQFALKYIEENRDEVMRVNREIDERHARGNTPEIQAKLEQASANAKKFREWLMLDRSGGGSRTVSATNEPFEKKVEQFKIWLKEQEEIEYRRNGCARDSS